MKFFTCTILETGLESAMDLPGWSHCSSDRTKRAVSYYPFEVDQVRIYFRAKHRTQAAKQIGRCPFTIPRDLAEYQPETPARIVARKLELARRICLAETQRGDFSRLEFFRGLFRHAPIL